MLNFEKHKDLSLLVGRITVGAAFIAHGMLKFPMWQATPSDQMPAMMLWLMRILSIVEPLAGLAMILGIFVPIAGMILVIIMVGATLAKAIMFKAPFASLEATGWVWDLVLLGSAMMLKTHGAGKYSLQSVMSGKTKALMKKPESAPQNTQPPQTPVA